MANELVLKPSYWACVSGGKDSLFMLKLIMENTERYPLDGVVHCELEIDYPFIKNVIDYMESECKKHGIKFVRIKPRKSYWELYEKYGFPTSTYRWCNSKYKMDSVKQLKAYLKDHNMYLVSYIGYCADEQKRIANNKDRIICPIDDFGIEEHYILEWAKNVPLFNNYYKFNDRCGCMYCPLASMQNLAYLYKYYPVEYMRLMNMARATEYEVQRKTNKPFSAWDGNPKYNTEYRDKRVREKYVPKLEER